MYFYRIPQNFFSSQRFLKSKSTKSFQYYKKIQRYDLAFTYNVFKKNVLKITFIIFNL